MAVIDLEKFRTSNKTTKSRVFTGRDRGRDVRISSDIDKQFANSDTLTIIVPDDIFSITPSFLEEFLFNIVRDYGKENVVNKLKFKGKYDISQSLDEAIDRILQKKNGLEH